MSFRILTCEGSVSRCPYPDTCANLRSACRGPTGYVGRDECPYDVRSSSVWQPYDDEHTAAFVPEPPPAVLAIAVAAVIAFGMGVGAGWLVWG